METTIRMNSDMLSVEFIEAVKLMFPHKNIEINIQIADDTDFILSNPAFAKELEARIIEFESKKNACGFKAAI